MNRLKFNPRLLALILGDLATFVVFAFAGLRTHDARASADVFLRTVLPLVVSWFAVSPWFGLFRQPVLSSLLSTIPRVLVAWLLAGTIALLARSWLFDRPLVPSFMAVVLGLEAVLLVGWRASYWAVSGAARRRRAQA